MVADPIGGVGFNRVTAKVAQAGPRQQTRRVIGHHRGHSLAPLVIRHRHGLFKPLRHGLRFGIQYRFGQPAGREIHIGHDPMVASPALWLPYIVDRFSDQGQTEFDTPDIGSYILSQDRSDTALAGNTKVTYQFEQRRD